MGILNSLVERHETKISGQATQEIPATENSPAETPRENCKTCGCPVWWQNAYQAWRCLGCAWPASESLVRRTITVEPPDAERFETPGIPLADRWWRNRSFDDLPEIDDDLAQLLEGVFDG